MLRLARVCRHVQIPALLGVGCSSATLSTQAAAELTGHYARLGGVSGGVCAEQAIRAFRGEVATRSEEGRSVATFASGCFWGPQLVFDRIPGVVASSVGYTQGETQCPDYNTICSGRSGHTEAVQVYYDEAVISYEELLTEFWASIDPTTVNGQGNDYGTQYRTGIYYHTEEQKAIALASRDALQKRLRVPIATEVKATEVYWPAEAEHQNYLAEGGRFGRPQSVEKGCRDPIRCYG